MNCETNEVRRFSNEEDMQKMLDEGFERLTKDYNRAAQSVLKGKDSGFVSFTSGGKLSKHAAKRRKELRKTRQQSRRSNRGKR